MPHEGHKEHKEHEGHKEHKDHEGHKEHKDHEGHKDRKYMKSRNLPLQNYVDELRQNQHFAFVRYGDGEWDAILRRDGKAGRAQKLTEEFHRDSKGSLLKNVGRPGIYFGIQNNILRIEVLRDQILKLLREKNLKIDWVNSDVFHYASRDGKLAPLIKVMREKKVVVIGPSFLKGLQKHVFQCEKFIEVAPENCYSEKEKIINGVLAVQLELGDNVVYSFSVGPSAEIFIPFLFKKIPKNFFIDFGSLWDVFCSRKSRNYTESKSYTRKIYNQNLGGDLLKVQKVKVQKEINCKGISNIEETKLCTDCSHLAKQKGVHFFLCSNQKSKYFRVPLPHKKRRNVCHLFLAKTGLKSKETDAEPFSNYSEYRDYQIASASYENKKPRAKAGQEAFIRRRFKSFDRNTSILDCACGDGVGLHCLKSMGFTDVTALELSPAKVAKAKNSGYRVLQEDMHEASLILPKYSFDIVYSSHSLEHAFDPGQVVMSFWTLLKSSGVLFVILPYPDQALGQRGKAHCGSKKLGLDVEDEAKTVIKYFTHRGFKLISKQFSSKREPEIWLRLEKTPLWNKADSEKDIKLPAPEETLLDIEKISLDWCVEKLEKKEYFSFPRYGDAEWIGLLKREGQGGSGLQVFDEDIQKDMIASLVKHTDAPGLIFGLQRYALRTVGRKSIEDFLLYHGLEDGLKQISWVDADVFHHASRDGLLYPLVEQLRKMKIVMVSPGFLRGVTGRVFNYCAFVEVPGRNCYSDKDRIMSDILNIHQKSSENIVYSFCCGPLAEPLILELHEKMSKNFLIDFGSLWDVFCGSRSRRYTKSEAYTQEILNQNLGLAEKQSSKYENEKSHPST